MNSLQQLLTRCYQLNRDSIAVPPKMLAGLEKNMFVLSDHHIQHHEVGPICRFLTSKNAMNSLEVLILNKSSAKTKRLRRLAATKAGSYSALHLFGGKLLKAVNHFLTRSQAVRYLEIDGITLGIPLLQALGSAISERQEHITLGFQQVIFRNVSLGGDGLRALSPYLGRCLIQCLTLENCDLGDDSLPYLSSIIKAHEAIQDKCYWNSTLRIYPERSSHGLQHDRERQRPREQQHVYSDGVTNTGLLLLNLSRNKYSSVGSKGICKLIHTNQWILGINLSNNCIEETGIVEIMECTSFSSESTALLCLHLRGNPGCSADALEELSERALQSMVNSTLASLPSHCAAILIKWLRLQEDSTPPQPSRSSNFSKDKRTTSSKQPNGHTSHKHDEGLLQLSSVLGAQDVHSIATDTSRSLRLGELQQDEILNKEDCDADDDENGKYNHFKGSDNNDIVCDEELPSGQNYLQDSRVDGFIPPSPGQGIDGRPPSRNSIRPRYDELKQSDRHGRDGRPTSAQASHTRQIGGGGRSSAPFQNNMNRRPAAGRSTSASLSLERSNLRFAGRGADRYTNNPYESTRGGGGGSQGGPQPRRTTRSSLDIVSSGSTTPKNTQTIKRPPFRPTSASARINSYEENTKAHVSYLDSSNRDLSKSHDYLRRSHSTPTPTVVGRGRQMTTSSSTRSRRRQSSIDLTRARQQKKRSTSTRRYVKEVEKKNVGRHSKKNAEILVEEMGKSVMLKLSKVVDTVSSELQNISMQMHSLTESMSESVTMINMSRDNTFTSYNDAPRDNHDVLVNDSALEEEKPPMNGHLSLSDLNREELEYLRLQQAMDEDVNLSLLIKEGLRTKLVDIIQNVMSTET